MNIKIHYTRNSLSPIEVSVVLKNQNTIFFNKTILTESHGGIIDFDCVLTPGPLELLFTCSDPDIYHNPMLITQFELDNFYQLLTFTHHGHNLVDNLFLDFVNDNGIFIESAGYSNCLFFTGTLKYNWHYPFAQMIFNIRHELSTPQ